MPRRSAVAVLVAVLLLSGCTSAPSSPRGSGDTAPPVSLPRYSDAPAPSPEQVAARNARTARAALPGAADVPGYAARSAPARLRLCPPSTRTVPRKVVHAGRSWAGTGGDADRTLSVTVVLDPANAPADELLATLLPTDCAAETTRYRYVYDRQPYETSNGWTGVLNTILATERRTGAQSYEAAYLLSKADTLVNVVAGRTDRDRFDPSVDKAAARALAVVLERL